MTTALVFPPLPVATNGTNGSTSPPSALGDVRGELMAITPQMAQDLLTRRLPNRPLSKARVRTMIADMRSGAWVTNGEPIILSEDLEVLDGQHRLQAIWESGVTIHCMVVVGIAPSAMGSIDQGDRRNGADMLTMAGLDRAQQLAATARWLYRYERNHMRTQATGLRDRNLPGFVQARPGLPQSLPWGRAVKDLLPLSCASMLHYLMDSKEPVLAKSYFNQLARGDSLQLDHPAHVTRERLLRDKSPRNHVGTVVRAALVVLAWGCLRTGRPLPGGLNWRGVSDATVPFPPVV